MDKSTESICFALPSSSKNQNCNYFSWCIIDAVLEFQPMIFCQYGLTLSGWQRGYFLTNSRYCKQYPIRFCFILRLTKCSVRKYYDRDILFCDSIFYFSNFHLLTNLKTEFHAWYDVEACIKYTPWQKMMIDDVIILIAWFTCVLQTRNQFCRRRQKLKNNFINQLLFSRPYWWKFRVNNL